VLVALALAGMVLPMAMFLLMQGGFGVALAGAVVLACLGGAVSAVGAVATAEQFPGEGRLSGLAFGATSATALFGGLTPWLAHWLIERSGWAPAPGAMIALVALCVLPVLCWLPETAPRIRKKADPSPDRPFA
jgi:MHS family proline/betaine transporter-like MFS transporter